MNIEDKLKEIGLNLPEVPKPVAEYIPAKVTGNLVFCSGQGPVKDGKLIYVGRVGKEISMEEGYEAAKMCALNCLAAIKTAIGSLDRIEEIVSLRGFVNSDLNFYRQPDIINGASELMVKVFGDKGKHARCALGVSTLPNNISVELEMVVSIK
ncbi:MAG TPA: RidA family protein [Atribacterota bacterium]|nr:RidA family protein [Atribacterota bacterium]HPK87844.1 RidA family protein [Atribacterota bacterium]